MYKYFRYFTYNKQRAKELALGHWYKRHYQDSLSKSKKLILDSCIKRANAEKKPPGKYTLKWSLK